METLSQQNPVLMIFEDAHWADPTSLESFGRVVDRIRKLRVLLLVTLRPEFDAPWVGRPYVAALTINRLAEREAGAMIDRIVGNMVLSASIRQDIIERTDGIPLVRGGDDQGGAGSRHSRRARACRGSVPGTVGPREPACLAHGATRPARRPGQGG